MFFNMIYILSPVLCAAVLYDGLQPIIVRFARFLLITLDVCQCVLLGSAESAIYLGA